jgi:UDP-N-acetylmuramoyl-L-alanyl-D-glutamate--2,6-diaminopimelate ligase
MRLDELAGALDAKRILGDVNTEIRRVDYDSRQCVPGSLFVAIRGETFDGHCFAVDAVNQGATAIAAEDADLSLPHPVPVLLVPDARKALAALSARICNYPTRRISLAGVTGTKGKSTTTYLIQSILNRAGKKAGVIGTLGARIDGEEIHTEHTTPESADLQRLFAEMVDRGVDAASMEVSSHGLYQHRTDYCEFDCGVFTNLTRDHLDFHRTLEAYLESKLIMFRDYPRQSKKKFTAVVNVDDPAAEKVVAVTAGDVVTYGIEKPADLSAKDIQVSPTGVSYTLISGGEEEGVNLAIGGRFNVYNSLAAAGAAIVLGVDLSTAAHGLAAAPGVPGRFERVDCGQDFAVIVDYAHTPDSLQSVLETARSLTRARVIAVFGCGGNRDKGKRPIMGKIAADIADFVVVTSDNPRKEEPRSIIDEILAGINPSNNGKVTVEVDRRQAIHKAIEMAQPHDIVLIAGKGHEDYQIFADETIHFDDREVVREILGGRR